MSRQINGERVTELHIDRLGLETGKAAEPRECSLLTLCYGPAVARVIQTTEGAQVYRHFGCGLHVQMIVDEFIGYCGLCCELPRGNCGQPFCPQPRASEEVVA